MPEYTASTYGNAWAGYYDEIFSEVPHAMIECLASLAGGGRVLELGIGTGRVALPLAGRGADVVGIEISEAMVDKLRQKVGGQDLEVVMGNMADVDVAGEFRLVYLVANTLFVLLEQDEQVRCFENVARHLEPGGRFVIEAFVPDLGRFDRSQRVQVAKNQSGLLALDAATHRLHEQRIDSTYVQLTSDGVKLLPVAIRYSWPAEIDLMGRLAGLQLENRWGGWDQSVFEANAESHVSVYRKLIDA